MGPTADHTTADPYSRSAVIIDRDATTAQAIITCLAQQGFHVHQARDAYSGVDAAARHLPDLVIVQRDLPGVDGFETVRRVREFSDAFVILLADDDSEPAIVAGFRVGADDYVLNPVRPYVLRARIDAMMRRSRTLIPAVTTAMDASDTAWLERGRLRLHPASRRVQIDGVECELTRSEFELLFVLARAKGQVFSKASLALMLREANNLPGQYINDHDCHAVEVHVMNLRRKLRDDPRSPRCIETVRGVGYRLAPAVVQARPDVPRD